MSALRACPVSYTHLPFGQRLSAAGDGGERLLNSLQSLGFPASFFESGIAGSELSGHFGQLSLVLLEDRDTDLLPPKLSRRVLHLPDQRRGGRGPGRVRAALRG